MRYTLALVAIAAATLGISYAISPLHTFNALVPKDAAARKIAKGLPYGKGERRKLDIYAPENAGENLPVIVFFYGGAWDSGSRTGYDFVGRALAAQGFGVVVADYRLVPDVHYPSFVEDGAQALGWVYSNIFEYGGDPSRIVLSGHSAGAYIAAMLAYDVRWMSEAERGAIRGFAGLAGPYDFAPFETDASIAAFGEWPEPAETQPINHVQPGAPPALILTGADDTTVLEHNGQSLGRVLREAGVSEQQVEYSGVDHIDILTALARPLRSRAPVLRDLTSFAHRVTNRN
ncbi:alpha/beta hydrolase [Aurantiacibacter poecillastricola]|uniref:alpha/beta hydrolase n=1 Tax=Aurantiacibacter poecillastricola TaxID=3064385 RepID=UPI00273E1B83|nr:alpha/beta hydrolase [Aurantiacibacter sp. 219JJ12-13]MDP5261412.1 alpha/beta hydrolase [Aurantiacibacter sp. 219JJ12-13]